MGPSCIPWFPTEASPFIAAARALPTALADGHGQALVGAGVCPPGRLPVQPQGHPAGLSPSRGARSWAGEFYLSLFMAELR